MTALDFTAENLQGKIIDLQQYLGKLVLVVNTASDCGYTPQYQGLENLYQQYKHEDLIILGFPCNQFGAQEPGNAQEIATFCERNYGITFPLFAKVDVNGKHAHPLFQYLKAHAPGVFSTKMIKWNFTKFLINKDGSVFKRYAPQTMPDEIAIDIAAL